MYFEFKYDLKNLCKYGPWIFLTYSISVQFYGYLFFQQRSTTLAAHFLVRTEEYVRPQRIMKITHVTARELVCLIMAKTVKYVSILTLAAWLTL